MPVATWRGFFGERARTSVYGWSERAFEIGYLKRNILGFTVHILLDPDLIEHVLLGNAGNYAKPEIVKSLLNPIIGRGLLTADADLWREQRKIVAATFSPAAVEAQRGMFVGNVIGRLDEGEIDEEECEEDEEHNQNTNIPASERVRIDLFHFHHFAALPLSLPLPVTATLVQSFA